MLLRNFSSWSDSVKASLSQVEELVPCTNSAEDLYAAYFELGQHRAQDTPQVSSRRVTCLAIAGSLAREANFKKGNAANCREWFAQCATKFSELGANDPRLNAMASTFGREANELTA